MAKLVKKEETSYTGGGIWIYEKPFREDKKDLVFVVDSDFNTCYTLYENDDKDGAYPSCEYAELMKESYSIKEAEAKDPHYIKHKKMYEDAISALSKVTVLDFSEQEGRRPI